jgi:hypothetical protein
VRPSTDCLGDDDNLEARGRMTNIEPVEVTRLRYRPDRITTLFVGESAPLSGDFFYRNNSALVRYMQQATEKAIGDGDGQNFLDRFKALGWYLDDLVLTPVDHPLPKQRKQLCREARASLAERIRAYQPLAIVSLLHRIERDVSEAADMASSDAPRYVVPFPGFGNQPRFFAGMARIVPALPKTCFRDG